MRFNERGDVLSGIATKSSRVSAFAGSGYWPPSPASASLRSRARQRPTGTALADCCQRLPPQSSAAVPSPVVSGTPQRRRRSADRHPHPHRGRRIGGRGTDPPTGLRSADHRRNRTHSEAWLARDRDEARRPGARDDGTRDEAGQGPGRRGSVPHETTGPLQHGSSDRPANRYTSGTLHHQAGVGRPAGLLGKDDTQPVLW